MKSRVLFLLAILVGSVNMSAQNLVPNGSFEEGVNCPSFIGNLDEECLHWFSSIQYFNPTNNPTPEWYHTCGELDFLTPPNVAFGYQEPFDGEGYVGVGTFNNQLGVEESYREPIGVELLEPLIQGSTYLVEFSIVRLYSIPTTLAANNFGFKFSNTAFFNNESMLIDNTATFKIDTIVSDTTNWHTVSTEIIADTNYSYVHFGNFFDNENTEFIADTEIGVYAYLGLDNVSITEVLPSSDGSRIDSSDLTIYPNPTTDKITLDIDAREYIISYQLLSLSGKLIKTKIINSFSSFEINMDSLPSGTYILHLLTPNNIYYEKIIKK